MPYTNPVVSGTVLVRTAIQSEDYVTGVSGWAIFRNGNVEFNNGTFRGSLVAGGGNVIVNSGGVHVQAPSLSSVYDINVNGGFIASASSGSGQKILIQPQAIFLYPANPSPLGRATDTGVLFATITNPSGSVERVRSVLSSPSIQARPISSLILEGESTAGDVTKISLIAGDIHIAGYIEDHDLVDIRNHEYLRGENGQFLISFAPIATVTVTVLFADTFSAVPQVECNIDSIAGVTSLWHARAVTITTSQFTYFLFQGQGVAGGTWTNIPVSWTAQERTP